MQSRDTFTNKKVSLTPEFQDLQKEIQEKSKEIKKLTEENAELHSRLQIESQRDSLNLLLEKPYKVIRDDLYESIPVSPIVEKLINTPQYLRLDRVKQLAFIFMIWPGAKHTRFQHSLGVFYLARVALLNILNTGDQKIPTISIDDCRTFLAAALLHDVGHYPYSHAIEEIGPPIIHHEDVGAQLITNTFLADVLEEVWEVNPTRVADLIAKKREELDGVDQLFHGLLSGPLDIDKLDYLMRDAHHCNVPYGQIDVPRLLESLYVNKDDDGGYSIGISSKGIGPLHSLIDAKRQMFANVYWHHGNRIATAMFLRAVQDALFPVDETTEPCVSPDELTGQDDYSIFRFLRGKTPTDSTTRYLIDRLDYSSVQEEPYARRLYKRALVITEGERKLYYELEGACKNPKQRRAVELELCETVGNLLGREFIGNEILLDMPQPENYEMKIKVYYDHPPIGCKPVMDWDEATGMQANHLTEYEIYTRKIRVLAVDETLANEIRTDPCKELVLGILRRANHPHYLPSATARH